MPRATASPFRLGRYFTIAALLAAAVAGTGLYALTLEHSASPSCSDADPVSGLAPGLTNEPPIDLRVTQSTMSPLGRQGPVSYHNRLNEGPCCLVIAHAGGSVDGEPYTNSREALDRGYALGRRVFEIDFSETCDGSLVLLHDWGMAGGDRLSRRQFLEAKNGAGWSHLDLDGLAEWILRHPDVTVVTDTKDNFNRLLKRLDDRLPAWLIERNFVVQVYDPATLTRLQQSRPNLRLILTIYKMRGASDASLSQVLEKGGLVGLTMPRARALRSLPVLRQQFPDLPIYVHGRPARINAPELHAKLAELGASGFYLE